VIAIVAGFVIDEPTIERSHRAAIDHHRNHTESAPAPRIAIPLGNINLAIRHVGLEAQTTLDRFVSADPCVIDAAPGAHLVLDGVHGPVSVLFFSQTATSVSIALEDNGVFGLIAPCQRGSVVILGQPGERFETIEQQIDASIRFI